MSETAREASGMTGRSKRLASDPASGWRWVDRDIWTERMLAALDNGVLGGKWIIDNGPTPSSQLSGCSRCTQPVDARANPDMETTHWRAVCGRTARTVRRAGRREPSRPYQRLALVLVQWRRQRHWIPAFAGMTDSGIRRTNPFVGMCFLRATSLPAASGKSVGRNTGAPSCQRKQATSDLRLFWFQ
jgi:hypothetical protein